MSVEFWIGLATLPVAAALLAVLVWAVTVIAERTYHNLAILGPAKYGSRARVLAALSDVKKIYRACFFYGWTVMVFRQNPRQRGTLARVAALEDLLGEYNETVPAPPLVLDKPEGVEE